MSTKTNNYYEDIIDIINNNVVFPAVNNHKSPDQKVYTIGKDILDIILNFTEKTFFVIDRRKKPTQYVKANDYTNLMKVYEICEQRIKEQNNLLTQEQEKVQNITKHGKMFEKAKRLAASTDTILSIENSPEPKTEYSVAYVKHFSYSLGPTEIKYKKWIVECYNSAKHMQLHGYEKHNKLVQGSGVTFTRKKEQDVFYGKEAKEIIDICESIHMQEILELTNNIQR